MRIKVYDERTLHRGTKTGWKYKISSPTPLSPLSLTEVRTHPGRTVRPPMETEVQLHPPGFALEKRARQYK